VRLTSKLLTGSLLAGTALGAAATVAAAKVSGPLRPALDYGFTPFEVGLEAEDIAFTSADGLRIAGWRFDAPGDDVVIVCHGHRGSKADMLGIGPGLHRRGASVLMFDFRGNGESADGPQSLAHFEQRDLEAAIDEALRRRPGARICVVGFSMGAAVTIQVAARDPRVAAVVADSSFADMRGVIAAAANGVAPLGLVGQATRFDDLDGYREVAVRSRRLGHVGAACIHPSQIAVLNAVFAPSEAEVSEALAIVDAARMAGVGAFALNGRMIDKPILSRAQALLERRRMIERKIEDRGNN